MSAIWVCSPALISTVRSIGAYPRRVTRTRWVPTGTAGITTGVKPSVLPAMLASAPFSSLLTTSEPVRGDISAVTRVTLRASTVTWRGAPETRSPLK